MVQQKVCLLRWGFYAIVFYDSLLKRSQGLEYNKNYKSAVLGEIVLD
jgi:hypothetical protein